LRSPQASFDADARAAIPGGAAPAPGWAHRLAKGMALLLVVAGVAIAAYGVSESFVRWQWGAVLLVLGTGLAAFGLFLRAGDADRQINGAISIVSIGLCLIVANLLLEFALAPGGVRQPDRIRIAREIGAPFDARSKYEVLADLRAEGRRAYPTFHVGDFLADEEAMSALGGAIPLGGVSHVLSVFCNETGAYTVFDSDRYGFHNDDRAYDAPGGVEILVVGDSYGEGACVPSEDAPAAQLRLRGRNAVSVASAGNGPLLELASLMEYGPLLKPKTILWLYYNGNDLQDLRVERRNPVLRAYLEGRTQNLASRTAELDGHLAAFIDAKFVERQNRDEERVRLESRLRSLLTAHRLRTLLRLDDEAWDPDADPETHLPLFVEVLGRAQSVAARWGGRIVFVYLPEWEHYAEGPPPTRQAVLDVAQRLGLQTIDFARVLDELPDPLDAFPFRIQNHYTPAMYRRLAEEILRGLGR
jgi:hypothetical protein